MELRGFSRAFERGRWRLAACDCLLHCVEVAGADEALVLHRIVAILLGPELRFLQRVVGHGFRRDLKTQRRHPVPLGGCLAEPFTVCVCRTTMVGYLESETLVQILADE